MALVVDPQRDIDRVLDLAAAEGVRITHVFETHIHNDYVTGGLALARRTGAAYFVNGADEVAYDRTPIADGDEIEVGPSLRVRAIATPGHTFTHLSYALSADGEPVAVFTGGSLLFGATGRPDLLGHEHTHDLVHAQYHSAQRLAAELPDATEVLPTHGFGSFCSATQSDATDSTIGREKQANPVLTSSEQDYVDALLDGLDAYPAYYVHMAPANSAGPAEPDLSLPAQAEPTELRRRIEAGEWVVDLRTRTVFAAGHVPGSLNFGLDGGFATYLGWLIDWGTPLTLLGETEADVADSPARARPHRHRPSRRRCDRRTRGLDRPAPGVVPEGDVRRPRPRPPPPRRRRPRRPPRPPSSPPPGSRGAQHPSPRAPAARR